MKRGLGQLHWQICLCYLDYVLVYSKTAVEHLDCLLVASFSETERCQVETEAQNSTFHVKNKKAVCNKTIINKSKLLLTLNEISLHSVTFKHHIFQIIIM